MKKIATVALALFTTAALAGAANADGPRHGPGSDRMVKHMTQELNLTDQQQSQMKSIFEEQGTKMSALREETKGKIDQVLTAEQQAQAKQLREERMNKWKEKKAQHKKHRNNR